MAHEENRSESDPMILELRTLLHDLCQPMTALQCRLELARMETEDEAAGRAMDEALAECDRLYSITEKMRHFLHSKL